MDSVRMESVVRDEEEQPAAETEFGAARDPSAFDPNRILAFLSTHSSQECTKLVALLL